VTSWIIGVLTASSIALLYVGNYVDTRQADWALLSRARSQMAASTSLLQLDEVLTHGSFVVHRRATVDGITMRVSLANSYAGRVFGVDLLQFDEIIVEVGQDGSITSVKIDYM
jgi:hypothetical protein